MESQEFLDLAARQLAEMQAKTAVGFGELPPGYAAKMGEAEAALAQSRLDIADAESRVADMQAKLAEMRQTFVERKRQRQDAFANAKLRAEAERQARDNAPLMPDSDIQAAIDRLIEAAAGRKADQAAPSAPHQIPLAESVWQDDYQHDAWDEKAKRQEPPAPRNQAAETMKPTPRPPEPKKPESDREVWEGMSQMEGDE